jgi:polysaccharide export outer membrane protein
VRPDGFISLPLLDDVKASGLTPAELKDSLTRLFGTRLSEPEVTVIALQVPTPVVYVLGDVNNSTSVQLRNAPNAMEAITLAGGFKRSAKTEDTVIIRLGEDGYMRAIPFLNLAGGQPGPVMGLRTMMLEPDDIVFVPENGRSQVARFLDDIVNRPLGTLTGILGLYVNFRLIQVIAEQ